MRAAFAHVRHWVFDLDNTLYPPEARLFDQIEVRMTGWIVRHLGLDAEAANRLRRTYWERYGTTLAGLMAEHAVAPEEYLVDVHAIAFDALEPDPALAAALERLPGRRIVYTNGSERYARQVLAARGIAGLFDAVYGVEHAGYRPKPEQGAYEAVFETSGTDPHIAAMFEDDPRNLVVPHAMGLRTVLVSGTADLHPHVHHVTDDLAAFLAAVAP